MVNATVQVPLYSDDSIAQVTDAAQRTPEITHSATATILTFRNLPDPDNFKRELSHMNAVRPSFF